LFNFTVWISALVKQYPVLGETVFLLYHCHFCLCCWCWWTS